MRSKRMLLAVLATGLAVPAGVASATPPPGSDFPWGQPPAWIPAESPAPVAVIPGSDFPWGQPPAWIPAESPAPVAVIPGSDFPWGQPPAWIPIAPA